jgi:uncharacterized membrane protein YbhN (UPF0104 family)
VGGRVKLAALGAAVATVVAAVVLGGLVDWSDVVGGWRAAAGDPVGLAIAVSVFGAAFAARALAWTRLLPGLPFGQSLAAIHLALGANHVLPLRLGEPLRVVSVVRRAGVPVGPATSTTVAMRTADVLALLALGVVVGPATVWALLGPWGTVVVAAVGAVGALALAFMVRQRDRLSGKVRLPDPLVLALVVGAWLCEAVVVWQVARWYGVELAPTEAVLVLAAAVSAQLVAIAPGGFGTYEAAAVLALSAAGVPAGPALALAVGLHGLKTAYSLVAGTVAVFVPAPGVLGRLRVPETPAWRVPAEAPAGPVVLFLPAHDEGPRLADVIQRVPPEVLGREVLTVVVDDGSGDDTALVAVAAGARVVSHEANRGLGAAVRTGLAEGVALGAAAVAFCDADGEYDPADLARLVGPILDGTADYVVGSRFAGRIHHMRPHRRIGNLVLSRWVRWTVRRPVTDGQSGYRALSAAAAAEVTIPHDYNYAQVLTVDLVRRGFVYAEVPISYRFRTSGRSFVRLLPYLRRVVPTVWGQLNAPTPSPTPAPH